MIIYYIYHLPNFVWKDGSIGKIGVSEKPKRRTKKQGYTDYEILEEHTCIYKVSDREIELQKEYGYKVDTVLYWKSTQDREARSRGGKKTGPIIGKITGKINADTPGYMSEIGKLGGNKHIESGHLDSIRLLSNIILSKSVVVYNKDGTVVGEYPSGRECARQLQIPQTNVTKVCKGKLKSTGGYVIKYKT
jgi:hypothetical protein